VNDPYAVPEMGIGPVLIVEDIFKNASAADVFKTH
jgi:hypothetical protein